MFHHVGCRITWFLTAVAALNVGLATLGYDIFAMAPFTGALAGSILYIKYLFGIAGAISLFHFFLDCCRSCGVN